MRLRSGRVELLIGKADKPLPLHLSRMAVPLSTYPTYMVHPPMPALPTMRAVWWLSGEHFPARTAPGMNP